jgi:hypothetical protein
MRCHFVGEKSSRLLTFVYWTSCVCAAAERLKAGGTVILNVGGSIHQVKDAKKLNLLV